MKHVREFIDGEGKKGVWYVGFNVSGFIALCAMTGNLVMFSRHSLMTMKSRYGLLASNMWWCVGDAEAGVRMYHVWLSSRGRT